MYLIAEIGINHNGSEELAKLMIKAAKDAALLCIAKMPNRS